MPIIWGKTRASSAFCLFAISLIALMLTSCGGSGSSSDDTADVNTTVGPVNVSVNRPPALQNLDIYVLDPTQDGAIHLPPSENNLEVQAKSSTYFLPVVDVNDELLLLGLISSNGSNQEIDATSTATALLLMVPSIMLYADADMDGTVALIKSFNETKALANKIELLLSDIATSNWVSTFETSLQTEFAAAIIAATNNLAALPKSSPRPSTGSENNFAARAEVEEALTQSRSKVKVLVWREKDSISSPEYEYTVHNQAEHRYVYVEHSKHPEINKMLPPNKDEYFDHPQLLSKEIESVNSTYIDVYGPGTTEEGELISEKALEPIAASLVFKVVFPAFKILLSFQTSNDFLTGSDCEIYSGKLITAIGSEPDLGSQIKNREYDEAALTAMEAGWEYTSGKILIDSPAAKCFAQVFGDSDNALGRVLTALKPLLSAISKVRAVITVGSNAITIAEFYSEIDSVKSHERFLLTNKSYDPEIKFTMKSTSDALIESPNWRDLGNPDDCVTGRICAWFISDYGWPDINPNILANVELSIKCPVMGDTGDDCYEANWDFGDGQSGSTQEHPAEPIFHSYPNALLPNDLGYKTYSGNVQYKDLDHAEKTKPFSIRFEKGGPRVSVKEFVLGDEEIQQDSKPFQLSDIPIGETQQITFIIGDKRPESSKSSNVPLNISSIEIENSAGQVSCSGFCSGDIQFKSPQQVTLTYTPNGNLITQDIKVTINSNDILGKEVYSFFIGRPQTEKILFIGGINSNGSRECAVGEFGCAGVGELFVMNADGSDKTRLTYGPIRLQANGLALEGKSVYDFRWSPDGTKIVYTTGWRQGQSEIWLMSFDGSAPRKLTETLQTVVGLYWSSDGKQVLYSRRREEVNQGPDIFVRNVESNEEIQLTFSGDNYSYLPFWLPDGRIVYSYGATSTDNDVFIMNSDGSGQANLTNSPCTNGVWAISRNGDRIFYSSRDGALCDSEIYLYVMNTDGTNQRKVTDMPLLNSGLGICEATLSPSPNSSKLAFAYSPSGDCLKADIYTINSDGGGLTNITNTPNHFESSPDWSTQLDIITFQRNPTNVQREVGDQDVFIVKPDGTGLTNLSDAPPPFTWSSSQPAWSP